jgi:putative ATP-dependent endonuclease of OLD family
MTYLLGANGSGKTAILQALARMFSYDYSLRRVKKSDFHVPYGSSNGRSTGTLWIEATFEFPELKDEDSESNAIPIYFTHMILDEGESIPKVRFRLTAQIDEDLEIEESFVYVIECDQEGLPSRTVNVPKVARNAIQIHYLPARRDPKDHISYAANSLLGRALRAVKWKDEQQEISNLTDQIGAVVGDNEAIVAIGNKLKKSWESVHRGSFFVEPDLGFQRNNIDDLLRHLTINFNPGHGVTSVDFSMLSDGQQSLLYISLVITMQSIGSDVLANRNDFFNVDKLRPPVFSLIAIEEPENSLSPHVLGRAIKALRVFSKSVNAQAVIATHAPSLLKRVAPEQIRYLRLDGNRTTKVSSVMMPEASDQAHKFVREALEAYPELYFSRLVVLGEGDSEEIVIHRLLDAGGLTADDASISVVPLGGRHVNHFWKLLHGLGIPYVTLLDLDLARFGGGWGRIRYVAKQLLKFPSGITGLSQKLIEDLPDWNGSDQILVSETGEKWLGFLEKAGVFFSSPLDLDFSLVYSFPNDYGVEDDDLFEPDGEDVSKVLGYSHGDQDQYDDDEKIYFYKYYQLFKIGSKPVAHIKALSNISNSSLIDGLPDVYTRFVEFVRQKLSNLPE